MNFLIEHNKRLIQANKLILKFMKENGNIFFNGYLYQPYEHDPELSVQRVSDRKDQIQPGELFELAEYVKQHLQQVKELIEAWDHGFNGG
jgi:hypothetical protein